MYIICQKTGTMRVIICLFSTNFQRIDIIYCHAEGKKEFLTNELLTLRLITQWTLPQGQNSEKYKHWITEKVFSNLSPCNV